MRNPIYVGRVESQDYGVSTKGDFEPLVEEATFYRAQAELEGAFADEFALLQPTAGYMRLVKDRILHVWEQRRAEAKDRTAFAERILPRASDLRVQPLSTTSSGCSSC